MSAVSNHHTMGSKSAIATLQTIERVRALIDGLDDLLAIHSNVKASEINDFSEMINKYVWLIGKTIPETDHSMSVQQQSRVLRQITESRSEMSNAHLDNSKMDHIVALRMFALNARLGHEAEKLRVLSYRSIV